MQCVGLESLVVPLNPPPEFEAGRLDVGHIHALTMGGPNKARGPIFKTTCLHCMPNYGPSYMAGRCWCMT